MKLEASLKSHNGPPSKKFVIQLVTKSWGEVQGNLISYQTILEVSGDFPGAQNPLAGTRLLLFRP